MKRHVVLNSLLFIIIVAFVIIITFSITKSVYEEKEIDFIPMESFVEEEVKSGKFHILDDNYMPGYYEGALEIDVPKALKVLKLYFPNEWSKSEGPAEFIVLEEKNTIFVILNLKDSENIFVSEINYNTGEIVYATYIGY